MSYNHAQWRHETETKKPVSRKPIEQNLLTWWRHTSETRIPGLSCVAWRMTIFAHSLLQQQWLWMNEWMWISRCVVPGESLRYSRTYLSLRYMRTQWTRLEGVRGGCRGRVGVGSAVVVFLFLAGLWFSEAVINGPNFHPKSTLAAPPLAATASHVASHVDWPSRTLLTVRPARQDAVYLRHMTTTALLIA